MGQNLTNAQRTVLRRSAQQSGLWRYVEPVSLSPTWVRFDRVFGTPACSSGGLDGVFGTQTYNAVRNYQRSRGLAVDGIIGCNT